ncbi:MAG: cobalamin biosynthesis protein [Acetobacteraceae bacterium]|nr:cobalamin biosynthesis protein [Acetobacteraceae bacterium]
MRRGSEATEIVALVRQAIAAVGRPIAGLAAPAFKRGEAGLPKAAFTLGVELLFVDDAALGAAQRHCVTHSAIAERAVGYASVAEASALAAAGPRARLVLPRIRAGGLTCAMAEEA